MKRTKMVLVTAGMIFAGSLFAQEPACKKDVKGEKKGRNGMRCEKMMKDLNLTEDQKVQMKTLHENNRKKMEEAMKAVGEARKALMEATEGEEISESEVKTLSSQLADAIAVMTLRKANMMKEVKAILTDEQKEQFEKKHAEMKKRMGEMGKGAMRGKGRKGGCCKGSKKACDKKQTKPSDK